MKSNRQYLKNQQTVLSAPDSPCQTVLKFPELHARQFWIFSAFYSPLFILQIGANKINWSWRLHLYNKKQIPGVTRQAQQILSMRRCDHDICRNRRAAVLNKWKVSVTMILTTREVLLGKDRANNVLSKEMPFIFSFSKFIILLSVWNWFIAGFPCS